MKSSAVPVASHGTGNTTDCQTRKLGTDLVVCLEGKTCPFAVPYGYLSFCKNPDTQNRHYP